MNTDYLVEMEFAPFSSVPNPQEALSFAERFVRPTLETCEAHLASGRIVAGGTALGATRFIFIARSATAQELENMLTDLPLWPRAHTRVVPLGTFANRARMAADRAQRLQSSLAGTAGKSSADTLSKP